MGKLRQFITEIDQSTFKEKKITFSGTLFERLKDIRFLCCDCISFKFSLKNF